MLHWKKPFRNRPSWHVRTGNFSWAWGCLKHAQLTSVASLWSSSSTSQPINLMSHLPTVVYTKLITFVKPVSVFLACSAQGRLKMHRRAPEPLSRNEMSCSHCMRIWHSWLSVWKEEFLSNVAQQALLVSPKVSLRLLAGQAYFPPYREASDMKAGCLQTGK